MSKKTESKISQINPETNDFDLTAEEKKALLDKINKDRPPIDFTQLTNKDKKEYAKYLMTEFRKLMYEYTETGTVDFKKISPDLMYAMMSDDFIPEVLEFGILKKHLVKKFSTRVFEKTRDYFQAQIKLGMVMEEQYYLENLYKDHTVLVESSTIIDEFIEAKQMMLPPTIPLEINFLPIENEHIQNKLREINASDKTHLFLIGKLDTFTINLYKNMEKWNKAERFCLCEAIRNAVFELEATIIRANRNSSIRLKSLQRAEELQAILLVHIRTAFKLKYIEINKYIFYNKLLTDIHSLLVRYIKAVSYRKN